MKKKKKKNKEEKEEQKQRKNKSFRIITSINSSIKKTFKRSFLNNKDKEDAMKKFWEYYI